MSASDATGANALIVLARSTVAVPSARQTPKMMPPCSYGMMQPAAADTVPLILQTAKKLLALGVDPSVPDARGVTAVDAAISCGKSSLATMLQSHVDVCNARRVFRRLQEEIEINSDAVDCVLGFL